VAAGTAALGAERDFGWDALQKARQISAGTVLPPDNESPFHHLKVEGRGQPATVTVLTIERPEVTGPRYAVTGRVRYEAVEGTGYLELWNDFPNGGQYFTRTLADIGPMMKLQGTSGWRQFALPFDATGAPPPSRLVLNVVLQGRGTVYLGPLQLADVSGVQTNLRDIGPRTLDEQAGLFGGIAGGAVGCVGALIGLLASLGRARRFVITAAGALVVFGTIAFAGGLVALGSSQTYAVYYPLLLVGFLSAVVPLGLLPAIRKRYEEIELRTMRAHDLGH
jgi:hypothetical protein